ncbi:hypothetical protein FJ872_30790 [Mesorhizobium sp. B2-5-9]|uniref:hypothetical protein n=1 Tax=Mesorhizobium sp. B2-5-9 TaxID=2589921 RepID=UPI0011263DBA|nr:hypothetical protein [Mesorhizobium sp. B2-5-9]TPJ99499.1 hypothetical protein FJ872_30790 [Mesorhizobium sp. B2-5-9]
MNALKDRMDMLAKTQSDLDKKAEEAAGEQPLHPSAHRPPDMPDELIEMRIKARDRVTFADMLKNADWYPAPVRAWNEARAAEAAAIKATWDEYKARLDEQQRLIGWTEKEAEFDDVVSDHWDIGRSILEIPAQTVEGMAVKARAAKGIGLLELTGEAGEALELISADIMRLAGGAA